VGQAAVRAALVVMLDVASPNVERHTSSNTLVNLASRSRIRNRNDRQLVGARRGAGSRPWPRNTRLIELADTPNAKTKQLTVDRLVAPSWVLAGKPHDQLLHLVGYRGPSVARRNTRISISLASADRNRAGPAQGRGAAPDRRTTRPRDLRRQGEQATAHRNPSSSGTCW
jgi:hypothetical protein